MSITFIKFSYDWVKKLRYFITLPKYKLDIGVMSMKINFETANNNQNVENNKTSYNTPSKAVYNYNRMGFKIDISGNVMDNKAYAGHGKTAEDVMLSASQKNVALERNYMAVMSNSMSGADFAKLQKEGYRVGQMDIETVVTIVDKIKATMAQSGQVVVGYTDDLSTEQLKQITGNISLAVSIQKSFERHNVPVTKENVRGAAQAFAKAQQIPPLSDGAMKYLITNNQEPTIDNAYLAGYSSLSDSRTQAKGYFADDMSGYYGRKADGMNVDKLNAQMQKVIEQAGLLVYKETMNEAKWLVESGIMLTADAMNQIHDLKAISFPIEPDDIVDSIARALSEGKKPQEALLTQANDIYSQARKLMEDVSKITDEAIAKVVEEKQPLTIRNLKKAMQSFLFEKPSKQEESQTLISARRQLEEVRLQMTVEANVKLLKSGFSIDTAPISEVVEQLKAMEADSSVRLYGTHSKEDALTREQLYKDTLYKTNAIKEMPISLVGKFAFLERSVTLDNIYERGVLLSKEYAAANRSYETMMTTPRSDLGDSIQSAFRNIDHLLYDMDMEASVQNNRAVRILAYNQIPINKESMAIVKSADETLQRVVEKMTPANTLYMVRDGVNPLQMDLQQLYDYLNQIPQTQETDVEKFAKFIYKLDKKNEISQEEKEACIGIFRLLRQLEKSDYRAVGAVVDANQSLTLQNLLTAVRTHQNGHFDETVDTAFGANTGQTQGNSLISEQINSYYAKQLHNIYDKLEPEKLLTVSVTGDTTVEELQNAMEQRAVDEELEQAYEKEKLNALRNVAKVSDEAINTVLEGKVTKSADYYLAAEYLQNYRGVTMNRLHRLAKQTDKATRRATTGETPLNTSLKQAEEALYENFDSREAAKEGYENFIKTAKEVLEETTMLAGTQEIDLESMVMFSKQMQFLSDMAKEENYEIPIAIGDEITSINLKLVHNKAETPKVSISLQTMEMSKVLAQFQADSNGIRGFIASSSKNGLIQLQNLEDKIISQMKQRTDKEVSIQFAYSGKQDFKLEAIRSNTDETIDTKELYQIAKGFLFAIKEGAGNESKL